MAPNSSPRPAARSGTRWRGASSSSWSSSRSSPCGWAAPDDAVLREGGAATRLMNRFWQTFLGIERSPGTIVGDTRLELTALPRGAGALAPIVAAALLIVLLWLLYRHEGRDLSRARRGVLVGLRVLTLLAVAAMLVEPVLVFTRRE